MQSHAQKCIGLAIIAGILLVAVFYFLDLGGTRGHRLLQRYTDTNPTLKPSSLSVPSKPGAPAAVATIPPVPIIAAVSTSPAFVHQSWKTKDLPQRFIRWFSTWDICFPSYEHKLWTDADNLELVRQKEPEFLDQFVKFKYNIQRADSARYIYMYHYGGIYSDLDNECLRSFQHVIDSSGCGVILGNMRSNGPNQYVQNSFFYSRQGHPFWRRVIEVMKERKGTLYGGLHPDVDLTTGPQLLMHTMNLHKKTYEGTTNPGPICVFPDTYFNPFSWDVDRQGPCKELNRMTETELALCKKKHRQAYVIQYHTQSWGEGKV